jgi:hypothetical protein
LAALFTVWPATVWTVVRSMIVVVLAGAAGGLTGAAGGSIMSRAGRSVPGH